MRILGMLLALLCVPEYVKLVRVNDGDTVRIAFCRDAEGNPQECREEPVRLRGIKAPETRKKIAVDGKAKWVDVYEPCGKEATLALERMLSGKVIRYIQAHGRERDDYHRLLGFVEACAREVPHGPDEDCQDAGEYLLRLGMARADRGFGRHEFSSRYEAAEKEAQGKKAGVWGGCG